MSSLPLKNREGEYFVCDHGLNLFSIDVWMPEETSDFQNIYNGNFIVCGYINHSVA